MRLFHLLLAAGILAGAAVLGALIQRIVISRLHAWARNAASDWDDIVAGSIKGLFIVFALLIGLAVVFKVVPLPPEALLLLRRANGILGIVLVVVFFVRVARRAIYIFIDRRIEMPGSIFKNFAAFVISLLGFLFALDYLGISITPLLTALGVGGLAVALAFQDTLANLFAGMNILLARRLKLGDYIRLSSGEEGEVCDITWRNMTLRSPEDNMVVVPNSKLAAAIYTNTHLPSSEMGLFLPVTVAFDSDLALVERVTLEVAREVLAGPERAIDGFEPAVRFNAFTDIGVRFSVGLRVREYPAQYRVRHEFLRRLHERFRAEGIKLAVASRADPGDKP